MSFETGEESPYLYSVPKKGKRTKLRPVVRTSYNTSIQLQSLKAVYNQQISEEYQQIKSKYYEVHGSGKKSLHFIQSGDNSPISEVNNKTFMLETIIDKRLRAISQTHVPISEISTTHRIRKEFNFPKNQPFAQTVYFSDPIKRVLKITPGEVNFGDVFLGQVYSKRVVLTNQGTVPVKILVTQPKLLDLKVNYRSENIQPSTPLVAVINLTCRNAGDIKTEFEISCKNEVYSVDIRANVLGEHPSKDTTRKKFKKISRKVQEPESYVLTLKNMNPHLLNADFAVRGDIANRCLEIDSKLRQGEKFPFTETVQCNIGNPHFLSQKPLTWIRQGLALASYPELLLQTSIFPNDIVQRISHLLSHIQGGVGAYTESQGLLVVRETVCRFIEERDGLGPVSTTDVFLSNGASPAIEAFMTAAISGPLDGILTPIPQYPLYKALTELKLGTNIGFYLGEEGNKWSINCFQIRQAIDKARLQGVTPKILVVINPGNPTGQVLAYESMKEILDLCQEYRLILMADEVYQDNIYDSEKKFYSFRKVALEAGSGVEIVSFHSISKGFFGECGLRGGYMHLINFDPCVKDQIFKMVSIMIASNTLGQVALELALNPPKSVDPSYEKFVKEKDYIQLALMRKAKYIDKALNKMENISCNDVEGAMYAFPSIVFTKNAISAAGAVGMSPDKFYVMRLLEETGVVLVPGCGFGQRENTYHFRITTLPTNIEEILQRIEKFNEDFHRLYQD